MLQIRPSEDRGTFDFGWLQTRHSFSFGEYHDPAHMHWGPLRVINEDIVQPGRGFDTHPHRDMEILTWVLSGELTHRDSTGGGGVIRPGELQRMSAGTGIFHSELNEGREPVHLLQIWVFPEARNLEPRYGQKPFETKGRQNRWQLLASRDGREGSLDIHQDADLWVSESAVGNVLFQDLKPGRLAWVQVMTGSVKVNGVTLKAGDGAGVKEEARLDFEAMENASWLLFDMKAGL